MGARKLREHRHAGVVDKGDSAVRRAENDPPSAL
jgi:hypothetical protein